MIYIYLLSTSYVYSPSKNISITFSDLALCILLTYYLEKSQGLLIVMKFALENIAFLRFAFSTHRIHKPMLVCYTA